MALLPLLSSGELADSSSQVASFWAALLKRLGLSSTFETMLGIVVVVGLLRTVLLSFQATVQGWIEIGLEQRLRERFVTNLGGASYSYFSTQAQGRLNNCLTTEIGDKVMSLTKFVQVVSAMVFAVGFLSVALVAEPMVTLGAGVVGLVAMVLLRFPARYGRMLAGLRSRERGRMQQLNLQFLNYFKYLKATASNDLVANQVTKSILRFRHLRMRGLWVTEGVRAFGQLLLLFGIAAVMYSFVIGRGQPVAAVIVIGLLFYRALQQLVKLQESWQAFCNRAGAVEIVAEIEEELQKNQEISGKNDRCRFQEAIELNEVSFAYCRDEPVLHDISLKITKGEMIGIAGPSGAGKSTLVDLLTGLIQPSGGQITFDGDDYGDLCLKSIRSQIAYVIQEPVVFHDTVANNISLWRGCNTDKDRAKLDRAADVSRFDEVLKTLPNGYDEVVGDRGVRLSGGQRQRLSIAREVYKGTPILIFDEATASLDSETEQIVHEGIQRLAGERTIILIAHRMSTLRDCDRIYVLRGGKLIEEGNFTDLNLRSESFFHRLCVTQGIA